MRFVPDDRTQRGLALGNLVSMTGTGATMSALVVFLSAAKHLPLGQAASLLATSGLVGVLGAVPVGQLSDRYGARSLAVVTELVCALATVLLLATASAWLLALCLAVRQLATSGNTAARATLMGKLVPPEGRVALRAYQRSVSNIGFSVGALLAALAMSTGTTAALYALLALDAATFCVSALTTSRLPAAGRGAKGRGLGRDAMGDRGYLTVSLLNAVHALNRAVVSIGVPLWIVYGSDLPPWTTSAAMILNTVVVIALQARLSRPAKDVAGARRALLAAGALTAVGCAALATAERAVWPLFVTACLALALGEILGAAAGWTLSYDLAPDQLLGQYQGMWQLIADGSAKAAGPAVIGWTVAAGPAGWALLAGCFAGVAAASPPVVTWASARTRRPARTG
ncbi:MFS transporter [Streptomyces sp. NPDC059928]|uniref:MFS transporter n=1 Tax=unclassified Streptomyces TaxID=2593676 RepID=UPI003661D3B3